ncbi:Dehydrodolichyl diphosphate synthase complex subunit Nus1 [Nymphon striatum]|nr:Dehydrodolichyl diphosphate synthase complex subunit Nus1 [Nymphon striatum]
MTSPWVQDYRNEELCKLAASGFPDPDLLIRCGKIETLLGFLPWQIRLTEMLRKLWKAEQNFESHRRHEMQIIDAKFPTNCSNSNQSRNKEFGLKQLVNKFMCQAPPNDYLDVNYLDLKCEIQWHGMNLSMQHGQKVWCRPLRGHRMTIIHCLRHQHLTAVLQVRVSCPPESMCIWVEFIQDELSMPYIGIP